MSLRRAALAAAVAALLLPPAATAQRRHPALAVEDAYRQALAELAVGSFDLAVGRIVGIERVSSSRCVQAIELHTARKLVERAPESLVAQAVLRLALHEARPEPWRRAVNLFEFEHVSVDGLRDLGELYLKYSASDEAGSLTGKVFTSLAYMVAAARSGPRLDAARSLLETAAELDPDHPAVLLSMAVNLELRRRPAEALPHLERLVALEPDVFRYRIRHALVTLRSGRTQRGQRLLADLRTRGPTWTRSLATQELARFLLAAGHADQAATILREGLLELPGEKLSLQLAALLDPDWRGSWEVLAARLAAPGTDGGPSPRWTYEEGAREEIEALRRALESAVENRSAALAKALIRLPGLADDAREADDDAAVRQTLEILAACR